MAADAAEDAKDAKVHAEVDAELQRAKVQEQQEEDRRRQEARRYLGLKPGEEDTLHRVERLEQRIEDETKSQALAEMLGGMKMDMYMLREKINMLNKEVENGVKLEAPDPAESMVFPLSVCMQCILCLTAQYFLIYTAMAACRQFAECFDLGSGTCVELALRGACDTVFYAPMLCVLFLGAQLRAMQISQGESGPPATAELAMQACTWSVFIQTLIILAIPAFSGRPAEIGEHGVKFDGVESKAVAGLLTFLRYAAMLALYVGFSVVCIVVLLMDTRTLGVEPVDLWDDPTTAETEYGPILSTAMACTMRLTFLFFSVYIAHAVLYSMLELSGGSMLPDSVHDDRPVARIWVERWEQCLRACTYATNLAPMVCVLFMAARMRSLELNEREGKPQWWTEGCFHICEWAIFAQVGVVLLAKCGGLDPNVSPNIENALARGMSRPDLDESVDFGGMALEQASKYEKLVVGLRGALMFVTYASVVGVVVGLFTMHDPSKPLPPLSPSMHCAVMLACQYLTVYLGLFVAQVIVVLTFHFSNLTHPQVLRVRRWVHIFMMAESTVKLCPMTAILCIGTRMRALHLSDYKGSPQCWAQDAMYMASVALLVQLLAVLAGTMLSPKVFVDLSGTPRHDEVKYVPGRVFLDVVRAVSFLLLYGGVILVMASVLTIRPETAGCRWRGYYPLVH